MELDKKIIIPTAHVIANHQKLVAKTNAVRFIKPHFFKVDEEEISREQNLIPDKTSWLGMPVFDSLIITKTEYENSNLDNGAIGEKKIIGTTSYYFENCLMTVSQTKNIVRTPIMGRNGTVKEYMSDGDYEVRVQGMIVGSVANQMPDMKDLNALHAIISAPTALNVQSNFLDMFRIASLVVESYELSQIEGTRNGIGFSMTCVSDQIYEVGVRLAKGKFSSVLSFQ